MEESKLEKICDKITIGTGLVMCTAVAGGLLAATIGAVGAGIYEGSTGHDLFGKECPTVAVAAGAGYLTPILSTMIPDDPEFARHHCRSRDEGLATIGAIICPFGPLVSAALYGAGY